MAWDGVLVRFGEIGIKSAPVRRQMEERLRQNLEDALLARRMEGHVRRISSRLWMTGGGVAGTDGIADVAVHTFGVVTASPAVVVDSSMEAICKAAIKLGLSCEWTKFAIRASRTGEHKFSSNDLGIQVGSAVFKAAAAAGRTPKVDLRHPDLEIHVEVRDDKAWLFVDKLAGPGGLPMGSQGKALVLISNRASAVAAWMMMRRGCSVIPLHVGDMGSAPLEILDPLWNWALPPEVILLPACTGSVSKQILLETASEIAREKKADAIVTGETLFSSMRNIPGTVTLRPVCGLVDSEVDRFAKIIGLGVDESESILDDNATETVESLLSMRRTVGP